MTRRQLLGAVLLGWGHFRFLSACREARPHRRLYRWRARREQVLRDRRWQRRLQRLRLQPDWYRQLLWGRRSPWRWYLSLYTRSARLSRRAVSRRQRSLASTSNGWLRSRPIQPSRLQ